jgi:hypothetical protein
VGARGAGKYVKFHPSFLAYIRAVLHDADAYDDEGKAIKEQDMPQSILDAWRNEENPEQSTAVDFAKSLVEATGCPLMDASVPPTGADASWEPVFCKARHPPNEGKPSAKKARK